MLQATTDTLHHNDGRSPLTPANPAQLCALPRRAAARGAALRHQLQVLKRSRPQRLRLAQADRLLLVSDDTALWLLRLGSEGRGLPRPLLKFSGGSIDILRDVLC